MPYYFDLKTATFIIYLKLKFIGKENRFSIFSAVFSRKTKKNDFKSRKKPQKKIYSK
jgi:hypothetical protein